MRSYAPMTDVKRKFAFYCVAYSALLLMLFVLGEIVVRLFLPSSTIENLRKQSLLYQPTNVARYGLVPSQSVVLPGERVFEINTHGYRGAAFAVPKPDGVTRVMVLGGSSVFDLNVSEGEDWPYLVQERLRASGLGEIEVVNAGVPGYTSFDSVGRLYAQTWKYEPDYLLLYNAWNDIKYFKKVNLQKSILEWRLEYAKIVDPRLHYQGIIDRFFGRSELYSHLRFLVIRRLFKIGSEGVVEDEEVTDRFSALAVDQYRVNLELFVDLSRNLGATPILMTQATLVDAENTDQDKGRINYKYSHLTHEGLVRAYDACEKAAKAVATNKRVSLIDASLQLSGRPELFTDHVHLTSDGGQELAALVAAQLEEEIRNAPARDAASAAFLSN